MFWILLSCCNLPLPAANPKFQVFPTKVAACCAAKRVTYKLYTFPSNENSNGVSHPTRMSHGSPTRMSHGGNTLGPGTSASAASKPGPASHWQARPGQEAAAVEIVIADCSAILLWPF